MDMTRWSSCIESLLGVCIAFGMTLAMPATANGKPKAPRAAPSCEKHRTTHCSRARDRAAILRMAGTFDVTFTFEEDEALTPGYELAPPYVTSALEVVSVLEDRQDFVSLQHVLLIELAPNEFYPLKHWRQDWKFQDTHLLEYNGDGTWTHRDLKPHQVRCSWSQAVFQVDDGPRYESFGRFSHSRGVSTWTSRPTFRPLPRRESARQDYDVLLAVNTHHVWADGWDHDEDNLKWVLASRSAIVHERGYNAYLRSDNPGSEVAARYLETTGPAWADVRAEWESLLGRSGTVRVHETIDGVAPYDLLFASAEELAAMSAEERRSAVRALLAPYVEVVAR
jgi:hypothetical protein